MDETEGCMLNQNFRFQVMILKVDLFLSITARSNLDFSASW